MAEIYKGYRVLSGNTALINERLGDIEYVRSFYANEYILIRNEETGDEDEMRFDGERFVGLKLPPSKYIKAKNALQRCALDILNNQEITVAAILGGYGSGKTHLAMQMALYNVQEKGHQSKILGVRSPWGEGKEIGFLPGSVNDKTDLFFMPLVQQLNGGEFELERLKQCGVLDSNIPYFLKGTTYNETVIVVDEAEDLTAKEIRLVGTRLGQNSKIFFSGDYKQSVLETSENNPLVRMCEAFRGDPKFGCIHLETDVRSETSKMFAELFEQ